ADRRGEGRGEAEGGPGQPGFAPGARRLKDESRDSGRLAHPIRAAASRAAGRSTVLVDRSRNSTGIGWPVRLLRPRFRTGQFSKKPRDRTLVPSRAAPEA